MTRLARWGGLTALFLALITLSIFLTINAVWLYRLDIHWLDISQTVQMAPHKIMHNYYQMLGYLELPWVTDLKMSNFPTSYTGMIHFHDVKNLFLLNNVVLLVSLTPAGLYLRGLHRRSEQWRLLRPTQIAAGVPLVLGAMLAVNFNGFFIAFHEVLFRNNDWIFDPDLDPIINALPDTFFLHCFIMAFVLFEAGLGWLYWRGRVAIKNA
ncbi:TIGR01906 family membrane protein [Levilactobacillus cerevisiae]|uniref:TIGR01906 family membrane protein n=1 Tax=Levilactobacillus cerevisiae TaxID=1704076 RepID=UPI000F7B4617|nr:TIGR01906 family membrane protein [Levilactobacillus cerevisiae]